MQAREPVPIVAIATAITWGNVVTNVGVDPAKDYAYIAASIKETPLLVVHLMEVQEAGAFAARADHAAPVQMARWS